LALGLALWLCCLEASAQQLPLRHYDLADGLLNNSPTYFFQDSKGYLWIETLGGLCRYDGYRFVYYDGRKQFGDYVFINSIAEDRQGRIWVSTEDGAHRTGKWIARLADTPVEMRSSLPAQGQDNFKLFQIASSNESNKIHKMVIDSADNIWCLTDAGLYRAAIGPDDQLDFHLIEAGQTGQRAYADSRGCFWFERPRELVRLCGEEKTVFTAADVVARQNIADFAEDSQGRLYVANTRELFLFIPSASASERGRWQPVPLPALPRYDITSLAFDRSDTLWIGTNGLLRYRADGQKLFTWAQGLSAGLVSNLLVDKEGNLWIGVYGKGLSKLVGEAFVSYTKTEGLPDAIRGILAGQNGEVYACSRQVAEIVGGRVVVLPGSGVPFGEKIKQDHLGNWWVGTTQGLYRFDGPRLQFRRGKKFTPADGIPEGWITSVEVAPDGTIWTTTRDDRFLRRFKANEQEKFVKESTPFIDTIFWTLADSYGNLWLASHSEFGRRTGAQVTLFAASLGLPETRARIFFQDSRGWLWIGLRTRGLSVVKDVAAAQPEFFNYSIADGLSGDQIEDITEDEFGRLYLLTDGGVDQFDPRTNHVRHLTAKDGLAGNVCFSLDRDASGNIWITTEKGVTKFDSRAERQAEAPPIYFDRLNIAGEEVPLRLGTTQIPERSLTASQNTIRIEFVGINFQSERALKYQYRLEGIDAGWSAPVEDRVVTLAQLAPGAYHLLVRSINRDGVASLTPAMISFRILPPVWQRWWFIASAFLLIGVFTYAAYRYRIARLMELERTRLRIARDLHDEVGSGLGSIGILSSLAAEDDLNEAERKALVSRIAATSGEINSTLGEIVWALRLESATLESLAYHLTERAGRMFPASQPEFTTDFPAAWPDVRLSLSVRRNLQLIAIEALHNAARHAQARRVVLGLAPAGRRWQIKIADDGIGFGEGSNNSSNKGSRSGMGLNNMRSRAAEIGAEIIWQSEPEKGTTVIITFDPQAEDRSSR
jgi:ligand-binding sensor domain-containing protein/signal transduction histidine kinase